MAATKDVGFPDTLRDTTDGSAVLDWSPFTTPGTNRMLVAVFLGNGAGATAINSFTSTGLTWTNRLTVVTAGGTDRVEIWTAFAASVVTGEQIQTAHVSAGRSYSRRSVLVFSLDGSDSSGVGNVASNNAVSGDPSLAVTATAAGSFIIVGLTYRSSGGDIAVDGNTTSEYDAGFGGGFGFNERAGSRTSSGAGALTLGWAGDDIFAATAIGGIEIKAAAGGGETITVDKWQPHTREQRRRGAAMVPSGVTGIRNRYRRDDDSGLWLPRAA